MAQTLNQIQSIVQFEARDRQIDLTTVDGLALFNMLYRRITALFLWPELSRTDSSLSTTKDDSSYTWPTTYRFIDVRMVEIQNPYKDNKYEPVMPSRTQILFARESSKISGIPTVYQRKHDGTNHIIEFAPAPYKTGLGVRISGLVEPTELTAGGNSTIFLNKIADDALAFLVAADYAAERNQPMRSKELVDRSAEILSALSGREILPSELRTQSEVNNG